MTDPAQELDEAGEAEPTEPIAADVAALVAEAMTKSGVIWISVPGDRAWPVWHAWNGASTYVVNGPGEQWLPWLPEHVELILRSQDTGGRILAIRARAQVVAAADPSWAQASAALLEKRLNAGPDTLERWREQCTITELTPFGGPLTSSVDGGYAPPPATRATTGGLTPAHLFGRPQTRRGTR